MNLSVLERQLLPGVVIAQEKSTERHSQFLTRFGTDASLYRHNNQLFVWNMSWKYAMSLERHVERHVSFLTKVLPRTPGIGT